MNKLDYGKFCSENESENAIKILNEIGKVLDKTHTTSTAECKNAIQRILAIYDLFEEDKK